MIPDVLRMIALKPWVASRYIASSLASWTGVKLKSGRMEIDVEALAGTRSWPWSDARALVFLLSVFLSLAAAVLILQEMKPLLVLALLVGLFMLFRPRYFFVLPLALYMLVLSDEATMILGLDTARLTKWLGIVAVLLLLIRGFLTRAFNAPHRSAWLFIGFGFWGLLTIFWSIDPNRSKEMFLTLFGLIVLSVCLSLTRLSDEELRFIRETAVAGGMLIAVLSFYAYLTGRFDIGGFAPSDTPRLGGHMVEGWWVNPNGLASSMFLPISFSLSSIVGSRSQWRRVWSYASLIAMMLAILFAQSRAAILGVACLLLLVSWRLNRARLKTCVVVGILVILGWEVLRVLLGQVATEAFWLGSGRARIWGMGIEALKLYWIVGAGLGTFNLVHRVLGIVMVGKLAEIGAHNIYLQMVVELGVVGVVLFVLAMASLLGGLQRVQNRTEDPLPAVFLQASLFGLLIFAFFHGLLREKFLWMTVGLSMLVVVQDKQNAGADKPPRERSHAKIMPRER